MAWSVKRGLPAGSSERCVIYILAAPKPWAGGPEWIHTVRPWNGASDFLADLQLRGHWGKRHQSWTAVRQVCQSGTFANGNVHHRFFSRHRTDVGRSREPLCSTWRIPRTEVTTSPPTVIPAKVTLFSPSLTSGSARFRTEFSSLHYIDLPAGKKKKRKKKSP